MATLLDHMTALDTWQETEHLEALHLLIETELISVLPAQVIRNEEWRLSDRLSLWTVYQDA